MKEVVAVPTDQPLLFRQEPLEARGALGRLRERPLVLQALQRALGAGQERFMIAVRIRSVVIRSVLRRVVGLDVPHFYCGRAVAPVEMSTVAGLATKGGEPSRPFEWEQSFGEDLGSGCFTCAFAFLAWFRMNGSDEVAKS